MFLRSLGFTDEGWIDEDGTFWPCDEHMKHEWIAACVLDMPERDAGIEADERGWLRISDYGNRTAAKKLNQRQLNTLFDYCEFYGCDFEEVRNDIGYI